MRFRKISVTAVLTGVIAISFSAGAPAYATVSPTLPLNQHLFSLDCGNFLGTLWGVDSSNANSTLIGVSAPSGDCSFDAQVNPVDGVAYAIVILPGDDHRYLASVDTATGISTKIARISGDAGAAWQMVITNSGDAFVASSNHLYSLNLTTGRTTSIGDSGAQSWEVLGYNPRNDTIYGYSYNGAAFTVNRANALTTADTAHSFLMPVNYTCPSGSTANLILNSVVFDSNGNPWFENDGCDSELLVQDFATGAVTYKGQLNDTAHALYSNAPYYDYYSCSIFLTTDPVDPALGDTSVPELSSTGSNTQAGEMSFSLSASLVASGVLAIVAMRRRARKLE